ncbi:hypothetical protein HOY82DRAFT_501942 [Tuber indicum]|nr:hypothetical protein HOY82DRAFT_501942 [Tuber indicum]
MGLKDFRGPTGERRTSDIYITCKHLVSRERLRAEYKRVPVAGRLLGSLVYKVPCVELHNCRPGHGLMDCNVPPSLTNL